MAKPNDETASGATPTSVACPHCGAQVTAEASYAGDKGILFQCPNCGRMFGIVPGIPNAQQRSSWPPPESGESQAHLDPPHAPEEAPDTT
jgi:predicted RNA-binding Zn-ribbon protein involved in translation (DUF1610 family)